MDRPATQHSPTPEREEPLIPAAADRSDRWRKTPESDENQGACDPHESDDRDDLSHEESERNIGKHDCRRPAGTSTPRPGTTPDGSHRKGCGSGTAKTATLANLSRSGRRICSQYGPQPGSGRAEFE